MDTGLVRWTTLAVFGASLAAADAAAATFTWASHADLDRCLAVADPPDVRDRAPYCAGLFPASRRERCATEAAASPAQWQDWCAAEWAVRSTRAEADGPSLHPGVITLSSCGTPSSPIVVDVLGDGFALTDAASGVAFDIDGDGKPETLAWTAPDSDDAWLVLDRNQNGRIDDGTELFGNFTSQPVTSGPNGFMALAVFDEPSAGGNGDGRIDAKDPVYGRLRLWQDKNHDGVSQPAELISLPQAGIEALSLDYRVSSLVDRYGNVFRYVAGVEARRGASVGPLMYDVFLVSLRASAAAVGDGPAPVSASSPSRISCTKACYSISSVDMSHCIPYELSAGATGYDDNVQAVLDEAAYQCYRKATQSVDRNNNFRCTDLLNAYPPPRQGLFQVGDSSCVWLPTTDPGRPPISCP